MNLREYIFLYWSINRNYQIFHCKWIKYFILYSLNCSSIHYDDSVPISKDDITSEYWYFMKMYLRIIFIFFIVNCVMLAAIIKLYQLIIVDGSVYYQIVRLPNLVFHFVCKRNIPRDKKAFCKMKTYLIKTIILILTTVWTVILQKFILIKYNEWLKNKCSNFSL